jgi:hypothetical protein
MDKLLEYEGEHCLIRANSQNISQIQDIMRNNFKIDNIAGLISEIKPKGLYSFVSVPDGCQLYHYPDGTVSGVFRGNKGQIKAHAKLKQAGINAGNIFKIAANQVMFAYIIVQLKEINEKLDFIIQGQHNDRIAEIEGAIRAYEHHLKDNSVIITQIETGIAKLEKEINQLAGELDPNAKFGNNWLWKTKNEEIAKTYKTYSESIAWIFKGYETLLKIDMLSGISAGKERFIEFLETSEWKKLADYARGLPYKKTDGLYPEERWEKISREKSNIVHNLKLLNNIGQKTAMKYEIELKGTELLEVLHEMQ